MIQDDRSIVSEPDPFSARDGWACDDEEWSGGVEERGLRRKWRQLHVGKAVAARRLFSVSKQGVPSVDWGGPEGGLPAQVVDVGVGDIGESECGQTTHESTTPVRATTKTPKDGRI